MKIILQQDVKSLGKKGEVLEVSRGYARNFLLPQKLAITATNENINTIKQQKAFQNHKQQQVLDEARLLASQLSKVMVKVFIKTGEAGRIFGSVTSKDITEGLEAQYGLIIDKRKIELKEAIKNLGTYTLTIKLHPEVSATIGVKVFGN